MKKIKLINNTKALCKASAVLSLAVFQVSFFMKPYNSMNTINRDVAQSSEVVSVGGYDIDLDVQETSDSSRIRISSPGIMVEDGDEVDYSDLIPKNTPAKESLQEALNSYEIKNEQCLVRPEDKEDIQKLNDNLQARIRNYNQSKTKDNHGAVKIANYELARKLVNMGLLENFETGSSDGEITDESISEFEVSLSTKDKSASKSASALLNEDNADHLKLIGECHLEKLAELSTDEEQREYFEKYNLEKYVDAIRVALDKSPEKVKKLVAELSAQSKTADGVTDNQFGFAYAAQVHAQSAMQIQASLAEIQALKTRLAQNPNDVTISTQLSTKTNELQTQLLTVNSQAKAAAAINPALIADANALNAVNATIDQATAYWGNEAAKVLNGEQATLFSTATTTAPGTVAVSPAGMATPTLNYDTPLVGNGSTNLDVGNAMLYPVDPVANNSMRRTGGIRPDVIPGNLLGDQSLRPRAGMAGPMY